MNYVIICAHREGDRKSILLVLKNAPAWQVGKLNLPGGKIEEGESVVVAAHRELKEETGYDAIKMSLMGSIEDGDSTIFCMKAIISKEAGDLSPRPEETEQVAWYRWRKIYSSRKLIPNLRVIIPLILSDCWDWTIKDGYRASANDYHSFEVKVMSP